MKQLRLSEEKRNYISKHRKTPFIELFTKTPKEIICPHFWQLHWAFGCYYACTYCYLIGTSWGRTCHEPPVVYSNEDKLFGELEVWLKDPQPKMLNTGEVTDSLAITDRLAKKLIVRFAEQDTHKLLLLTKSDNVDGILRLEHNGQTIVSFSINPPTVAEKFELKAPHPELRLKAAWKCKQAGYPIRVRLDPMIPVEGWREDYLDLAEEINQLKPERVTLGSLRFFDAVPAYSDRDKTVFTFGKEKTMDGRTRLPEDLRIEMYQLMLKALKVQPISLCKEVKSVVKKLSLPQKCNCIL